MKIERRIDLAKKKYGIEPTAEMLCPKWDSCCSNICFLDSKIHLRTADSSDPQTKCKLPKGLRKQIGEFFKLKNKGLKPREISAMKKWAEMPEDIKKKKIANLKQNSPFVRLKSKGYKIARVKPNNLKLTHNKALKTPRNNTPPPTTSKDKGGD